MRPLLASLVIFKLMMLGMILWRELGRIHPAADA